MRKKNIITNNREIYSEFNKLYFVPEIILKDVKRQYVQRIIKNINKEKKILDFKISGEKIIIKKINPLNFNMYLKY